MLARAPLERFHHTGAGTPSQMKARHRIAVAHGVIAAALGPPHNGKNAVAHRLKPAALLAGCERDIGFGPFSWPVILVAVESGGSHPVLQRQVVGVLDAEPALLGCIDKEQSAERPESLPAEILLAFLIDHDHALACIGQFGRGHEARQPCTDDNYVRIIRHF